LIKDTRLKNIEPLFNQSEQIKEISLNLMENIEENKLPNLNVQHPKSFYIRNLMKPVLDNLHNPAGKFLEIFLRKLT